MDKAASRKEVKRLSRQPSASSTTLNINIKDSHADNLEISGTKHTENRNNGRETDAPTDSSRGNRTSRRSQVKDVIYDSVMNSVNNLIIIIIETEPWRE